MSSKTPVVSILVPCYNVEKFLPECLDSLVGQTLADIEIVCINDGSTDGTLAILKDYAARDSRVVVIDKPNGGYGHSMNKGLDAATGRYIGIVESDDFASLDMFEKLCGLADEHNADVVKSNYYTHSSDGGDDAIMPVLPEKLCGSVVDPADHFELFRVRPSIWAGVYNRQFLIDNDVRFLETPGASFQDASFMYKVWLAAKRAYICRDGYLHYRIDNAASSVKQQSKVFCVCDEYDEMERFLMGRNLPENTLKLRRRQLNRLRYNTYIWNYERLESEAALQFLMRMSEQFAAADKADELDWRMFNVPEQTALKYIINKPEYYHLCKSPVENPRVTVVMPVYNAEAFIRKSLDSLLSQTIRDIEIICIDDGSSDRSVAILQEYASRDGRVVVQTQPNSGAAVARNKGMAMARGKYLSILDCDDVFDSRMLEKLLARAEAVGADITICKCDGFDDATGKVSPISWSVDSTLLPENDPFCWRDMPDNIFNFCQGWAWDKLYLTSFVRDNKLEFQNLKATNDMTFVYLSLVCAERISIINDVLIHQRLARKTSISQSRHNNCDCFYYALAALRDGLVERDIYSGVERSFKNWAVNLSMWHFNTLSSHKESFFKLYSELRDKFLPDLGIGGQDEEYYTQKNIRQYRQCVEILQSPVEDYLYSRWQSAIAVPETKVAASKKTVSNDGIVSREGLGSRIMRKVRGARRCLREYGFGYTCRLAWGFIFGGRK